MSIKRLGGERLPGEASRVFFLAAFLLFLFASSATAQETVPLPETAQEGIEMLAVMLAAVGGLAASMVMDAVKKLSFMSKENRDKVGQWLAGGVTMLVAIGTGGLIAFLLPYAVDLQETGIWKVTVTVGPVVFAELRHRWRKAGVTNVTNKITQSPIGGKVAPVIRRIFHGVPEEFVGKLLLAGYTTPDSVLNASDKDLEAIGLSPGVVTKIKEILSP